MKIWILPFTKPPLLQESRLTGGGSPNLVVLVEWKVPVERFMGAANCFHWFYLWLYTCAVQTADWNWFWLLYLRLYSVKGFPLYEDTDSRRATTHQLYCFAIEVGFGANEYCKFKDQINFVKNIHQKSCIWFQIDISCRFGISCAYLHINNSG